ncbi:hypothetical protein GUJ93_ZPchr0004g39705 [Zizania palustris]|uniref:Uncharacterized protein n=1 Tax=Zizania palustris TaxID=103762 RepID=A0A8J5VYJ6_ZIZPA|nr:hypothetical protein GUJ93_ZPchr0004g39705 [Zizania palustris]
MSMRDLAEEFISLQIALLKMFEQGGNPALSPLGSTEAITNEPLVRWLKFIQAAAKMAEATMVRYGEVSERVATQGVLHYLEDVGSLIQSVMEAVPITFRDDHLLMPSLNVVAIWKIFQGAWKAEGQDATKAMMDKAHCQKMLRARPSLKPTNNFVHDTFEV